MALCFILITSGKSDTASACLKLTVTPKTVVWAERRFWILNKDNFDFHLFCGKHTYWGFFQSRCVVPFYFSHSNQ